MGSAGAAGNLSLDDLFLPARLDLDYRSSGREALSARPPARADGRDGQSHCRRAHQPRTSVQEGLSRYHSTGAKFGTDYELRNDLNVARISETKIAVCSRAAKWVPLEILL